MSKWKLCSVPGCPAVAIRRGLCATHLSRWRRTGDAQADVPVKRKVKA